MPGRMNRQSPEENETMSDVLIDRPELESLGVYEFGWHDTDAAGAVAQRGINENVVRGISALKSEPEWMLKNRLKGYQLFGRKPMPTWGADLSEIDFDNIKYFVRSTEKQAGSWEELPEEIRNTYRSEERRVGKECRSRGSPYH